MTDLSLLDKATRLLFTIELKPLQGDRFQPTGFPNLGAATYQTKSGPKLLVESAQSMANRMEATCWDPVKNEPIGPLKELSHVKVTREGKFLTDSMLEAHRLNSPYVLAGKVDTGKVDKGRGTLKETLESELACDATGPVNRGSLVERLLKYDIGSLLHGVFLSQLKGGRLRVARALSAFVEASGARVAASGGVKTDHIQPGKSEGKTATEGFGNIIFARDEFTAERIDLHVNFDLAQVRGYGLAKEAENLLILLGLHRLRKLIDGDLRMRTACDLEPVTRDPVATRPKGFVLPSLDDLQKSLASAVAACASSMQQTTVKYEEKLESAKDKTSDSDTEDEDTGDEN